jgi:hypothetical protein
MGAIIYMLCALTALTGTVLIFRSYIRNRTRLLFWSGLCFAGLFLNNIFLLLDKIIFPLIDFSTWRYVTALIALLPLLYGLIWEEE